MTPTRELVVDGVDAAYGKAQVLFDVSIRVSAGECVALLGANGAGKTTLLKAISGLVPVHTGRITWAGNDLTRLHAERIFRQGVAHVPEGRGLFPNLTLEDNVLLGAYHQRIGEARRRMTELLPMFPLLAGHSHKLAGHLSGGQQQMVAVLRALMSRPQVLLLDEPTLGLAPALRAQVLRMVRGIADDGVGVLLVDQDARHALSVAERCCVMRNGRITYRSDAATALANYEQLADEYLGSTAIATTEGRHK